MRDKRSSGSQVGKAVKETKGLSRGAGVEGLRFLYKGLASGKSTMLQVGIWATQIRFGSFSFLSFSYLLFFGEGVNLGRLGIECDWGALCETPK